MTLCPSLSSQNPPQAVQLYQVRVGEVLSVDEEEVKLLAVASDYKKESAFSTPGTSAEYILHDPARAGGGILHSSWTGSSFRGGQ